MRRGSRLVGPGGGLEVAVRGCWDEGSAKVVRHGEMWRGERGGEEG